MPRSRRSILISYAIGCIIAASLAMYSPIADEASAYSVHAPITISGDSGFTPANGVIGGTGTQGDPYVISGWDISGGEDRAIEIVNTSAYFVISGCYIHDSEWYAICLENAHNGTITGNEISFNAIGVRASSCHDLVISENCVTGGINQTIVGLCGIDIIWGTNLTLTNNTVTDIHGGGIRTIGVEGVMASGNVVSSNLNHGVSVFLSKDVRILNNSIQFNGNNGILETGGSGVFEIIGNSIMNNSDSGVLIWHGAEIARNTIAFNDWFGIGLNASGSLVHHNNIISNLIQAYEDAVIANEWDNGYPDGGNYWSDYAGVDTMNGPAQDLLGSDGIGDTPRVVPMGRADRYPLMEPFEANRPPVASFEVTPLDGDTSTVFEFNASSSWDYETSAGDLMFRWDWDGDGTWDTGWSTESTVTHQFATPGNYSARLEARDANGTTGNHSLQVEVVELIPEMPALYLPVMVAALCLFILAYGSIAKRRLRRGSD